MNLETQSLRWLQLIARDGAHPLYGPWQPVALDTLALLEDRAEFREEWITTRVAAFLGAAADWGRHDVACALWVADEILNIQKEVEEHG